MITFLATICVVLYILVGIFASTLILRFLHVDVEYDQTSIVIGTIFWPFLVAALTIIGLVTLPYKLANYLYDKWINR